MSKVAPAARPAPSRLARLVAALALVLALGLPVKANAQSAEEIDLVACALQQALAALTCKPANEFFFLGLRQGVFVYTGFWAMHPTEYYAQVIDRRLVIFSSPSWQRSRISARLVLDYARGCAEVLVQKTPCNSITARECCAKLPPPQPGGAGMPLQSPPPAPGMESGPTAAGKALSGKPVTEGTAPGKPAAGTAPAGSAPAGAAPSGAAPPGAKSP